ncbi:MAG: DegT/DnrJ/EryC1/StrS aminotransferase family protein [Nitrospirae bacterium]|nr:DegT/DnrJ/EryC1/StrS aminotransferase family protein [Nitrospirota bacterium]
MKASDVRAMIRNISSFPNINPLNYIRNREASDPILSQKRFFLYASGRAALYYAMKATCLPQNSRVLVPSFHCGVEVEAVMRAGYQVDFYNIRKDLGVDFNDLDRRVINQTRALVVIHYFGFPQNMGKVLEFCRDKKLLLIEDCAHALYSQYNWKWLGSFGAFGIYSLQKTIALPNGGGLLCNAGDLPDPLPGRKFFEPALLKTTIKSVLEYKAVDKSITGKISSGLLDLYRAMNGGNAEDPSDTAGKDMRWYYEVPRYDYHNAISALSMPLLNKESYEETVKQRRHNYLLLSEMIRASEKVKIMFQAMDEGVCPLCFVISVEKRDTLVAEMNRAGLYPFVFGRFHHKTLSVPDFPDAGYLSAHLLGLPVHQQLNGIDIETIADTFNAFAASHFNGR